MNVLGVSIIFKERTHLVLLKLAFIFQQKCRSELGKQRFDSSSCELQLVGGADHHNDEDDDGVLVMTMIIV